MHQCSACHQSRDGGEEDRKLAIVRDQRGLGPSLDRGLRVAIGHTDCQGRGACGRNDHAECVAAVSPRGLYRDLSIRTRDLADGRTRAARKNRTVRSLPAALPAGCASRDAPGQSFVAVIMYQTEPSAAAGDGA